MQEVERGDITPMREQMNGMREQMNGMREQMNGMRDTRTHADQPGGIYMYYTASACIRPHTSAYGSIRCDTRTHADQPGGIYMYYIR
jgi:hypothetical protein